MVILSLSSPVILREPFVILGSLPSVILSAAKNLIRLRVNSATEESLLRIKLCDQRVCVLMDAESNS